MSEYHVLFFHGKGSKPETSSTAKAVRTFFENKGIEVFTPDYQPDIKSLDEIESGIDNYINDNKLLSKKLIIIGISRGGYWALRTSNKIRVNSCFILNPAINTYNEKSYILPRTINRIDQHIYCHLNNDDELFDSSDTLKKYNDLMKCTTYPSGGHRMFNINDVLINVENEIENEIELT